MIKDFDELEVYKLSLAMANLIYDVTNKFPPEEKFGIISQLRRAVTSIGANIAEGYGRFHYKENQQFCRQARGSLTETRHFMLFSLGREYISKDDFILYDKQYIILKIKINNYIKSIGKTSIS